MNSSNTNSGGWESSYMRQTICSQFKNAMPSDLRAILRPRTIYTDNTGGGSGDKSSNITATTDTVYIPSESEVQGAKTCANSYERNYQQQLAYYKNGARKIRYKSDNTSTAVWWWVRSPCYNSGNNFSLVRASGNVSDENAYYAGGFAPLITI